MKHNPRSHSARTERRISFLPVDAGAFLYLFGLPALLLASACGGGKAADPGGAPAVATAKFTAPPVPVQVETVKTRDVQYTISAVGSLQAREIIRVPARVAGVVQDIKFEEGKWATPDQVLARIDPDRYRLAAGRAEANLHQAEAAAREAEAALAKRTALREKDPGWVTAEELSNFTAQLDQAQAAAASAKAAYDLAAKDLRDSEVRADGAGIINEKLVGTGQYVAAGAPVATIVDAQRLKLSFRVAESEAARLSENSPVSFRLKANPSQIFPAKLYHIGESADPSTRMVECLAWVENSERILRPGYFADVTVEVENRKGAIVVPQTAVLPTDRGFVGFAMQGEDRVQKRSLRLGLYTSDGSVEILEGFRPGDRVVVRGASVLSEDSVVKPEAPGATP